MSNVLVLAEKPEVAGDIAKAMLKGYKNHKTYYSGTKDGDTWNVTSAFGHLLELVDPDAYGKQYAKWNLKDLPLYFADWKMVPAKETYKQTRLSVIENLLKEADVVICAGDPDDEGQLLIDEILDYFQFKGKCYRVFINDNMEANIRKEFAALKNNDDFRCLSRAASARRMADKCFGVNESRLASVKLKKRGLSVGRVQTPTLGLVVARDEAIENHITEYYYEMTGTVFVCEQEVPFKFKPDKAYLEDNSLTHITDRNWLDARGTEYDGNTYEVAVSEKEKRTSPPLPYNLTALQADMNRRYGYSSSKTLDITQSLRSKKAITYNRSDSRYLKEEHFREAPKLFATILDGSLTAKYGLNFRIHSACFNDKYVTAHHGIIPQAVNIDLTKLSAQEKNVYLAIVEQYAKQFMRPLRQIVSTALINLPDGKYTHNYEHSCAKTTDPGFTAYFGKEKDVEESEKGIYLPAGTYPGNVLRHEIEEKETKPPARYTEGMLIKDMSSIAKYVEDPGIREILKRKDEGKKGENGSIGTVATRSVIIENLIKKGFLERRKNNIFSTDLGRGFYHILPPEISKADTTAKWWLIQEAIKDGVEPDENAIQKSVCEEFLKHKDTAYAEGSRQMLYVQKEKVEGIWNGEAVAFNRKWGTHEFTDQEVQELLSGQPVTFKMKGRPVSGKLAWQEYKGKPFFGFQMDRVEKNAENGYVTGKWNGKDVAFKREWGGHTFTDGEIAALLAGEKISFKAKSKAGKEYEATGQLAEQTFRGNRFFGFKPEFEAKGKKK